MDCTLSAKLAALAAAAALLFSGCAVFEPLTGTQLATENTSSSQPENVPQQQSEPAREERDDTPRTIEVRGVEGEYAVLPDTYLTGEGHDLPTEHAAIGEVIQTGGLLVLSWNLQTGLDGPTPVELVSPVTGNNHGQLLFDDHCYAVEETGEQPDDFRVVLRDSTVYKCSTDLAQSTVHSLPPSVRDALWLEEETGAAPYDLLPVADLLAFTADDGIYLSGLDGGGARIVLDNGLLPDWFRAQNLDRQLLRYEESELRYVAPKLMNGGRHLAATSYLMSDSSGNAYPVGVTVLDLETGDTVHYADSISWLSFPARRIGYDKLMIMGRETYRMITVSTSEIEDITFGQFDPHEYQTCDYNTFVCVDNDGGMLTMTATSRDSGETKTLLTATDRDYLSVVSVTQSYVLCRVGDDGGEHSLLAVQYARSGS